SGGGRRQPRRAPPLRHRRDGGTGRRVPVAAPTRSGPRGRRGRRDGRRHHHRPGPVPCRSGGRGAARLGPHASTALRRVRGGEPQVGAAPGSPARGGDRKSTRLNSSHVKISYAVFCLKKKKKQ